MDDADFDPEELKKHAKLAARSRAFPIIFFKSVVERLDQSINRANEDLRIQYPRAWESQKQIVRLTFGLGKRIELGFSETLCCTFSLTSDNSHLEALITNGSSHRNTSGPQLLAFLMECDESAGKLGCNEPGGLLKCAESAVRAYKMDLEPLPYALHQVEPQEIADMVVAGIVRGYFN